MNARPRIGIILAVAAATITAFTFQQAEIARLRAIISDPVALQNSHPEIAVKWSALELETEGLRIENERLRTENTKLLLETVEADQLNLAIKKLESALRAGQTINDQLTSAVSEPLSQPPKFNAKRVASSLAKRSPFVAAQWVASLPPGFDQDDAAVIVADAWAESDPRAAIEWVANFADADLREQANRQIAATWGSKDPNGAAAWLETMPNGTSKDAAIESFIIRINGKHHLMASEWANRIETPDLRSRYLQRTLGMWLTVSNSAAREWIYQANLPGDLGEFLLSTDIGSYGKTTP